MVCTPGMKVRMGELAQQKVEIEARLAEAPADLPDIHPNIAEHYRAKVIRLAETLAEPESKRGGPRGYPFADRRGGVDPRRRHPMRRVDGHSRPRHRPSEVFHARSYNKRACVSPQPLSLTVPV